MSGKEPYAAVEYSAVEGGPHQSLLAARNSISAATHYFPHESGQISDHSCSEEEEDTNKYDFNYTTSVITEEPKLEHSRRHVSKPRVPSISTSQSKSGENISDSVSSQYDSEDSLGIELGFIDYEHNENEDVRVCRTPERLDSFSEEYQLAIRTQSISSNKQQPLARSSIKSFRLNPVTSPVEPSLQLSVYFDEKHSVLVVHLLKAFNLPTKRPESTSNPFAEVYLLPKKVEVFETRTLQKTLSPVFDQAFKFCNVSNDDIKQQILVVRIYLHGKNHFLGGLLFSLEKANLFGVSYTTELALYDEEEGLKVKFNANVIHARSVCVLQLWCKINVV